MTIFHIEDDVQLGFSHEELRNTKKKVFIWGWADYVGLVALSAIVYYDHQPHWIVLAAIGLDCLLRKLGTIYWAVYDLNWNNERRAHVLSERLWRELEFHRKWLYENRVGRS